MNVTGTTNVLYNANSVQYIISNTIDYAIAMV